MFSFSSNTKKQKGQGLVEYAIILALVAIVVIGVMRMLGPNIGHTFSTINNSLGGEAATATWSFAANENGVVNVPAGVHEIQYGANGAFYTQTFTGPTTVNCNNSTFGDPIFGTVKTCFLK